LQAPGNSPIDNNNNNKVLSLKSTHDAAPHPGTDAPEEDGKDKSLTPFLDGNSAYRLTCSGSAIGEWPPAQSQTLCSMAKKEFGHGSIQVRAKN
jgi:hypothetical protein